MLRGISDDLEAFYGNIVEHLVSYVPPAPKLPKEQAGAPSDQPIANAATAHLEEAVAEARPTIAIAVPGEAVVAASVDAMESGTLE